LKSGFDFGYQIVNLCSGDGPFDTGNANAVVQFFAVEFLTGTISFDDERGCQNGAFVGAEALMTAFTFTTPTHTASGIMSRINNPRFITMTIRTVQESSLKMDLPACMTMKK
jgi:hypothetical protein